MEVFMNREERRKNGISKETSKKLDNLQQPCTILECIQLSQGVASDAIKNYHETLNPIIVSLSIQIEVLKEILYRNNVVDEKEFVELFNARVEDYNKQKEEAMSQISEDIKNQRANQNNPKTDVISGDIDVKVSN